jgi:glycosyltransferase involved in cell wall biosynthesis
MGSGDTRKKQLKLAMIGLRGIPHTYGGGEEFINHLGPGLADRGHKVTVFCRSSEFPDDREKYYRGVRRVFLPTVDHKFAGQFIHASLATMRSLLGYDVIYVHTLPSAPHTLLPWLLRRKIVVNTDGLDWERSKWGRVARTYFKTGARISVLTGQALVSDSLEMQRYYDDVFHRGSVFIPYGANIDSSRDPDAVRQYGLEPGGYYLIASRLVPENNADVIVEAFNRIKTDRVLAIAGGANYKDPWIDKLKRNAGPNVKFLGHVADQDHVKELHCNCFAYLHGHSVGGTNPSLLKALGYGNCVVALNVNFNREVLQDSRGNMYGIMFDDAKDLQQKLQQLEDNPSLAEDLRGRAPERIRRAYRWDQVIDAYERLFLACANTKGRVQETPASEKFYDRTDF